VGTEMVADGGLQSQLQAMHPQWSARFSNGARDALKILSESAFDAVVADVALPDMDGFQLLSSVQQRHPKAHRIILSDLSNREAVLKCAGSAHLCLPKPWQSETLKPALERAFSLNVWLSNPTVRELVGRMTTVPSPPSLYFKVVKALQSPNTDLEEIGELIQGDPAITAKLLQLSNSALLGLRRKVTSVREAISYLGLETTRSLVLVAHTFSYCDRTQLAGFNIEELWRHSLATGFLAREIARAEAAPADLIEESFLGGLLHDIGKLLLAVNLGFDYGGVIAQARERRISLWEAEWDRYRAPHSEVAAELLAVWNLPLSVVEAVALHHYPSRLMSAGFCPLTAVHVANSFEHDHSSTGSVETPLIDPSYIADLGMGERLEAWRAVCRPEPKTSTTR